jgi:hypothetical protein
MRVLAVFAVVCLFSTSAFSQSLHPASGEKSNPNYSLHRLRYAHLVIECTIKEVHVHPVTPEQLNLHSDRKVNVVVAGLDDVDVLRGSRKPRYIVVFTNIGAAELVGQRMLLCGLWAPKLGQFLIPDRDSAFAREGDHWLKLSNAVGSPPVSVTESEARDIIREYEIPSLTRAADLIVTGRITSSIDSTIAAPDGGEYRVQRVALTVDRALKGTPNLRMSRFFVARDWEHLPSWSTATPEELRVGETWIAFLKRDGDLCYPLGGVNGLLLFEGHNKVLFDRVAPYRYSQNELIRMVENAVKEH